MPNLATEMFSRKFTESAVSGTEFDFETVADACDMDTGTPYNPAQTMMSGAQLHFKTAPCVVDALTRRAQCGLFGYTESDVPAYLSAIESWMLQARGWKVEREWIVPSYGTLQAMCAAIRAFTEPGDGIIVQPPVYVLYDRILTRTRRERVENPLILENGCYRMDFEGLEALMAEPRNKLMLLCNPHNPIMDVWSPESLRRVAELAKRYGVLVISDEIFAEHVFGATVMTPYATLPDAQNNCIVCTSLGKAFNFTGESHANIIIPNPGIRERYIAQRNEDHYGSLSPFMYTSVLAAYTPEGMAWIRALVGHVEARIPRIGAFLTENLPSVAICRHTAGTLLWLDFRAFGITEDALHALFDRAGVIMDRGSKYGEQGKLFSRMQIGMPDSELFPALGRIAEVFHQNGLA
ncbi:MAG TPA: aminotransferase class I/II-fold pyridoxal phosphate-dependent enzyme [Candidatus Limiplasma sp.]|nr:aminotransferase class I/II-fold pyridoxal phosphate-dependent enzyme [Candidatus Limiplasma sp.]HPS81452.1 aminotransferase class I/II-fold pyridoxal phosphate-dependent enzyme [Candidatus Limiplasma sp.]